MIQYDEQIELLGKFYQKLHENKNGFMYKELNSLCSNLDGPNIGSHMEYYKVNDKQKHIIDLTPIIGKNIDMVFSDGGSWSINYLQEIRNNSLLPYISGIIPQSEIGSVGQLLPIGSVAFRQCRIREKHWHSCKEETCILPAGLLVEIRINLNGQIKEIKSKDYLNINWHNVTAFKITGTEDKYLYQYEDINNIRKNKCES